MLLSNSENVEQKEEAALILLVRQSQRIVLCRYATGNGGPASLLSNNCTPRLQAHNWNTFSMGAKPACTSTLEGQKPYFPS